MMGILRLGEAMRLGMVLMAESFKRAHKVVSFDCVLNQHVIGKCI